MVESDDVEITTTALLVSFAPITISWQLTVLTSVYISRIHGKAWSYDLVNRHPCLVSQDQQTTIQLTSRKAA